MTAHPHHTLAVELCAELEAHLAQCENCQIVLDTLRKTIYLVHRLPDSEQALPYDVERRLFATLSLEEYLTA
jgi:predicted anti-sigma-YlaC factor YlaD